MTERATVRVTGDATILRGAWGSESRAAPRSFAIIECRRGGLLLWSDEAYNLITDEGARLVLAWFKPAVTTPGLYVGLKGAGAAAAADTAVAHAGWVEITAYAETGRQILTLGTPAGRSVDNSAARPIFTATATATVAGFGLWSTSAKGGTGGSLYSAADFTGGSRPVNAGDALSVSVSLTG